jgi:hypothetical protein
MAQPNLTANPFALMMTPEAVFAAIERSDRLNRLKSRICRPLDGPRPPQEAEAPAEVQAFDQAVDAAAAETPAFDPTVESAAEGLEWPVIPYE